MFYTAFEKAKLKEQFAQLMKRVGALENELDVMSVQLNAYKKVAIQKTAEAPYGLRRDGTARAKPGRKAKA